MLHALPRPRPVRAPRLRVQPSLAVMGAVAVATALLSAPPAELASAPPTVIVTDLQRGQAPATIVTPPPVVQIRSSSGSTLDDVALNVS